MRSPKTSTFGAIGTVAAIVVTFEFSPLVTKIAACVGACASSLGLLCARDNSTSDEKAGAHPAPPSTPTQP